jgi:hypothetical protein
VINDPDVCLAFDLSGMLRGDFPQLVSSYVNLTRAGIASPDEARLAVGLDPRGGDADRLQATAVGGRPQGAGDGDGAILPPLNGGPRLNGAATAGPPEGHLEDPPAFRALRAFLGDLEVPNPGAGELRGSHGARAQVSARAPWGHQGSW